MFVQLSHLCFGISFLSLKLGNLHRKFMQPGELFSAISWWEKKPKIIRKNQETKKFLN